MKSCQGSPWMNIRQCAEYTGFSVGSLYQMVHYKRIPHYKTTNRVQFLKSDIDAWLKAGKVEVRNGKSTN